jgi:formamidopyrimidine-DNA glycosylase
MPELPEVETVARGVDARIRGDRVLRTWFSAKPEPMKSPPAEMARSLAGRVIRRVRRVGKHIVFDFEPGPAGRRRRGASAAAHGDPLPHPFPGATDPVGGGAVPHPVQWIVHLGMTGRLLVAEASTPRPPHTHGVLVLASGRELRFVDPRRFGRMGLHAAGEGTGFAGPGREPLGLPPAEFRALFRGRRTPIKAALLNQRLLHGVGNIYADESLFAAGIRPGRMAGRLSGPELDRLQASLVRVLAEAIRLGGSSISDYVDAEGRRGFFQLRHRVYMRGGEPCLDCGGTIRRTLVGGRGTHYCPRCQR